jgi:hypothetical protein
MDYRPGQSSAGTTSLGVNYQQEPEHDDTLQNFIDEVDGIDWGIKSDWGPNKATIRQVATNVAGYLGAARHFITRGDSEGALQAINKCLGSYPHVHAHVKNTLR